MINYDCPIFDEYFTDEKDIVKGLSIFVRNGKNYFLRFSVVNGEDEKDFIGMLDKARQHTTNRFNLSVMGEVAIKYCPWCGVSLNSHNCLGVTER